MPAALPIGQALAQSAPLARLQSLLRESNARFAAIATAMPPSLAQQVRPGPVSHDDGGWTLLARNAAVAAKLRQLLPRLEAVLLENGWPGAIRVRVQTEGA